MKNYYTVMSQPLVPGFIGKFSENEYETEAEAIAEAEAIVKENPLIKAEVWHIETTEDGVMSHRVIKVFCNVRFV